MIVSKGIVRNGQIVLDRPLDLPDGAEVTILDETQSPPTFLNEEEQTNDPQIIQAWISDLQSIPPVPALSEAEHSKTAAWDERIRQFNLEAVQQQFADENH
jgi:hypothetical protein